MLGIVFFTAVIEQFGVRSARAAADFPEVVGCLADMFGNHTDFDPRLHGDIVIRINRDIELLSVKADPFWTGQEFPGPGNRLFLEIVTDREVAEHLKERMMSRCLADILDIVGTDRFLRVGDPVAGRLLRAVKILLQGRYTGIDPEQCRIIMRNQTGTRFDHAAFCLPEVKEHLSDLIAAQLFVCHRTYPPSSIKKHFHIQERSLAVPSWFT